MTTPTPTATALLGLVDEVRSSLHCGFITPGLRAALAAWESREPLELDLAARAAVRGVIDEHPRIGESWERWNDDDATTILRGIDRALTGERP